MSDWIQEDYYRAEYEVIDYKARCPVCGAELVHESGGRVGIRI
jgi:ribosomal protein S27E